MGKMSRKNLIGLISMYLLWKKHKKRARKRREYVRGINENRNRIGAYVHLVKPMRIRFPKNHLSYFRMSKSTFDDLLNRIRHKITHAPTHRLPILAEHRLAMTLRYLCDGGSIIDKAFTFHVGLSTLTSIVRETAAAIWDCLKDEFLSWPDKQKWQEISEEFWRKWNYPMALGAVDGMHVAIKCPRNSGSLYFNYKHFFSIVLLAIVDANYNFIFVNIGGYGREGDAGLFNRWDIGKRIVGNPRLCYEDGGLDIPDDNYIPGTGTKDAHGVDISNTGIKVPHIFLGDDAFALNRHLMKPYQRSSASGDECDFNYRHSLARRVVENAFGILKSRFRILDGRIDMAPEAVDNIVKACVVLHSYLKSRDANAYAEPRYCPDEYVDYMNQNGEIVEGQWRDQLRDHAYVKLNSSLATNTPRLAYDIRERFKTYFASHKLPWQERYVKGGDY